MYHAILSEIILVNSDWTRAARSFDFEIMPMISDQIALHSVQLPLLIIILNKAKGNLQRQSSAQQHINRLTLTSVRHGWLNVLMMWHLFKCSTWHKLVTASTGSPEFPCYELLVRARLYLRVNICGNFYFWLHGSCILLAIILCHVLQR